MRLPDGASERLAEQNQKPEEMHRTAGPPDQFIVGGKPAPSQPNVIFRLGKECSLKPTLVAEHDVSQYSCMVLLVTALVLPACFGMAAWPPHR